MFQSRAAGKIADFADAGISGGALFAGYDFTISRGLFDFIQVGVLGNSVAANIVQSVDGELYLIDGFPINNDEFPAFVTSSAAQTGIALSGFDNGGDKIDLEIIFET